MHKFKSVMQLVMLCVFLIAGTVAQSPTILLGSCHDELEHLQKTASEAAEAAAEAKSKEDHIDDCRIDPEMHDFTHDQCRGVAADYQSALSDVEGKIDDIDSALRSVQDSCNYQFTINKLTSVEAAQRRFESSKRSLCGSYHKLLDSGMPREQAVPQHQMNRTQTLLRFPGLSGFSSLGHSVGGKLAVGR